MSGSTRPVHVVRRRCVAASVAVAAAAAFASGIASAADIEEVIVTAQKRVENIQDVPIAVSAFTTETLQDKAVSDIHALANFAPNVNFDSGSPFSGDSSVLSASIRGIGQDDFAFNLDPGVGVYLDGVYLARTIGANQSLLDVDRIEILKGPQGTLFGRNTIGGAINIVTHTPGDVQKITALVTTGSYKRRDILLTADIPLATNLLTSLSMSSEVRDGYQRVIPYPNTTEMGSVPYVVDQQTAFPKAGYATSDTKGGKNVQVIRGKALWKAADSVDVTFAGDWSHQDQSSYPTTVLNVDTTGQTAPGFGGLGNFYNLCISTPADVLNAGGPFGTAPNQVCGQRGAYSPFAGPPYLPGIAPGGAPLGGAGYVGGPIPFGQPGNDFGTAPRIYWNFANTQTGNIDTTYANGPSFAKYDMYGLSGTVDWRLAENMTLKSITGWRQIDWRVGVDLDGTPESIQEVTDHQFQHQLSQEFQLLGTAFDGKLNYVGGLYYFAEAGYVHDFVPFGGSLYIYDVANDVDTKAYAAFLHLDYKINDQWGVSLGGRYSRDEKRFVGGQTDLDGFTYKISGCNDPNGLATDFGIPVPGVTCQQLLGFPSATQPYRYFPDGQQKLDYDIFTPTAGIQFHVNNDVMLYGSYSKGFKAGGWTTRLSAPIPDIGAAEFGPEKNEAFELGMKSEWLDRHLQANMALFYSKYTGIQLNIQEGPSPVLHNAGDARLQGAELEMQAVAGDFAVNLVGAYIDAKYTSIDPRATAADPNVNINTKLPKTPEYKFTIGPQYDIRLPSAGAIRLAVDYTRTAEIWNDAPNTPLLHRPASDNLNAAIHYISPNDRYQLTLGGTNLTDDRYLTVGSVNGGEGETVGTYNAPVQWYLSLKMRFE
jgi:iron complex outermembrane recepter protein